jgi:hypothetical protein
MALNNIFTFEMNTRWHCIVKKLTVCDSKAECVVFKETVCAWYAGVFEINIVLFQWWQLFVMMLC